MRIAVQMAATAAAIAMLWTGVAATMDGFYRNFRQEELRARTAVVEASAASALANALNQRLSLVRGLAAFIAVKATGEAQDIAAEFPIFARAMTESLAGIRNISASPGFVVAHVYPADPGNLKVIGNDLLADKRAGFADAVRRAIANRGMTVHEPVTLIQGGMGLIARHAVYRHDEPWGAVGVVFDVDPILHGSGLTKLAGYEWGVRTAADTPVGGSQGVFAQSPVTSRIDLPEGYWELALVPVGGWKSAVSTGLDVVALRGLLAFIGVLLVLAGMQAIRRRAKLEHLVEERTAALAAASGELGQLAHAVTHDLQEPLRTITSYSQLLDRALGDSLAGESRHWLAEMVSSARRMKSLLVDVQTFLDSVELPLPTTPYPAEQALAAARHRVGPRMAAAAATIEAGPLPAVMADGERLGQIFHALLSNALLYAAPDRPPVVRITAEQTRGATLLHVADNGQGIEAEYLEYIFGPFRRLHGRATHPGNGMGLAIARKLAGQLGGTLTVRSRPGEGSVFTLSLPGTPNRT